MRIAILLIGVLALGACGEKEQVVVYKQGKYQGKPDSQSWANAPLAVEWRGSEWKQGDRACWEESFKKRQLSQNEYKRIYQ